MLAKNYGDTDGKRLLALAILGVVSPSSTDLMRDVIEDSYLREMLNVDWNFEQSSVCRFIQKIGRDVGRREELFCELSVDCGKVIADVNWNSVSFNNNRAGVFILLTPPGISWEDAVEGYVLRNEVEEVYDAYKNDLDGKRIRTPDAENARGRFFVRMLSLMMIVYVRKGLREYSRLIPSDKRKDDRVHNMTVREMTRSLNSVMVVGNTGNWRLTHITKTNRQIFFAFGLDEIFIGKMMDRTDLVCNIKYRGNQTR